jgi:hypothetical protein
MCRCFRGGTVQVEVQKHQAGQADLALSSKDAKLQNDTARLLIFNPEFASKE